MEALGSGFGKLKRKFPYSGYAGMPYYLLYNPGLSSSYRKETACLTL